MKPSLIVALDGLSEAQALKTADDLRAVGVQWFKIGLELFTKAGPDLVLTFKDNGLKVFLDLKLHDIPNTVEKATAAAVEMRADLMTIHASGGSKMISAAASACAATNTKLLAVTVLTSLDSAQIGEPREAAVLRLANVAAESGADGIVCSPKDLQDVPGLQALPWKNRSGLFVTPGIRNADDAAFDQSAIATPEIATRFGATHLVVGRPILQPAKGTPAEAAQRFIKQIEAAK